VEPALAGDGGDHHAQDRRRLVAAAAINGALVLAEVAGWAFTGSLALLADAAHNLTDVGAIALAYFAMAMSLLPRTSRRSFGYHRWEILAALANGIVLVVVSIGLFVGAALRLAHPPAVSAAPVVGIALLALAGNLTSALLLLPRRENLNVRAAFVHLAADALSAVGVIVAGLLLLAGFPVADPVATIVIGALIVLSGWGILREAIDVLLEATPATIEPDAVRDVVASLSAVRDVHDVHVWALAPGRYVATLHVVVPRESLVQCDALIDSVGRELRARFGIQHTTVQVETGSGSDAVP
jgi:cobalt-zinc-cadmium efflux system protein